MLNVVLPHRGVTLQNHRRNYSDNSNQKAPSSLKFQQRQKQELSPQEPMLWTNKFGPAWCQSLCFEPSHTIFLASTSAKFRMVD